MVGVLLCGACFEPEPPDPVCESLEPGSYSGTNQENTVEEVGGLEFRFQSTTQTSAQLDIACVDSGSVLEAGVEVPFPSVLEVPIEGTAFVVTIDNNDISPTDFDIVVEEL